MKAQLAVKKPSSIRLFKTLRIVMFIFIAAAPVFMLSGCARTDYAENQAYAVMLGIDITDNEQLELSIKYPVLSGSSGGSGSENVSAYATEKAQGQTFQRSLDALKISLPCEVNLSALTMVIISEELIECGKLDHALDGLTRNYRMYSSSYLAVCKGKAAEFIEKQEPQIGSRLSEGLKAMSENLSRSGVVPVSRLADVYYRMDSVYSDPMIMLCRHIGSDSGSDKEKKANTNNIYEGACIISDHRSILELDDRQSVLANVLAGNVTDFMYTSGDIAASLTVDKGPDVKISAKNALEIEIELQLSGAAMISGTSMKETAEQLQSELTSLIEACKKAKAEPFGFADKTATHFLTLEDWINYDWRSKFAESSINIEIIINEVF